jgi:cytochrome c-type biogenesis protein
MDGTTQRVADHSGKVLILDFWATYCPPCIEEMPHLNALREKYGPDKIEVIGLNVGGDDDRPKIPDFVKKQNISYPIAFPEDALLTYISGDDDRIPQTAVFNKKGDLVLKVVGYDPAVKGQIDIAVESAISQ